MTFAYDAHSNSAILDATLDKYSNRSYYSWNLLTGKVGVFSVPIDPVFIDMDIDPYTGYIYGVNYYSVYMRKSSGFQQVVVTEPHDILFITNLIIFKKFKISYNLILSRSLTSSSRSLSSMSCNAVVSCSSSS